MIPASDPNPKDQQKEEGTRFRWKPALGESLLFTGIMHTFNLTTEAGTRDALNGPLVHALHSIRSRELRGWSDSDKFMAPYVGHPIEGSVFGFIERQNDPQVSSRAVGRRPRILDQYAAFDGLRRRLAYTVENRPRQ